MDKVNLQSSMSKALAEIYERDGEIRPSALIEEARPKDSPIHDAFEWNNSKAAFEYRLMQARQWIRRVKITIEEKEETLVHIPHFVVVGEEDDDPGKEGYYKPISALVGNLDEYNLALKQTMNRLSSARAAYDELKRYFAKAEREQKEIENAPNFAKADRGFRQIESALNTKHANPQLPG